MSSFRYVPEDGTPTPTTSDGPIFFPPTEADGYAVGAGASGGGRASYSTSVGSTGGGSERVNSNLWLWGRSQDGQAGFSSVEVDHVFVVPVPTPITFPSAVRIVAVSCGSRHTLALDDQAIPYSWGWGLCGQLGQGDYPTIKFNPRVITRLAPGTPDSLTGGVKSISAGGIHSAAVDLKGHVYTWGESSYGQLGLGPDIVSATSQPWPTRVMLPTSPSAGSVSDQPLVAAQVSCGGMHTGAVTRDGKLYTWGRADNGQLGIGRQWMHEINGATNAGGLDVPHLVDPSNFESPVKQLSCGAFHTAVVTVRGMVYTWGREEHGMLGHDVPADKFTDAQDRPKEVETQVEMGPAVSVSCGGWHTCVVTESGKLFTCGRGEYGRLGLGDQKSHLLMEEVNDGGFKKEHVIQCSAGGTHTMVLTKAGHIYSYGRGHYGRLGHGDDKEGLDTLVRPKLVTSLMIRGYRVTYVSSGGAHSAALVEPCTEAELLLQEESEQQQGSTGQRSTPIPIPSPVSSSTSAELVLDGPPH